MKIKLLFISLLIGLFSCKDNNPGEGMDMNPMSPGTFAVEIGESSVPYIVIDTEGVMIENEPKVAATMDIYESNELIQSNHIGIEYRGASSFRLSDKKSYGIETWDAEGNDIDVSFFGFPEEEDWILLGHVIDPDNNVLFDRTLMYNHIGHELYRRLGRYTSRTEFVEVEINGVYQGVYLFMEKLKRDKNRIDISKLEPDENEGEDLTGGYVIKIDKASGGEVVGGRPLEYYLTNWEDDARYTEAFSWRSEYNIFGERINFSPYQWPYHPQQYLETYFLYEYPKAEEITAEQRLYIQNYIGSFENSLVEGAGGTSQYEDFIDVGSFVDYFIINELCRNVDAYRLSTYLHKGKNQKLKLGPVWDFNIGFDGGDRIPEDRWVIDYNSIITQDAWMVPFWWPILIKDERFISTLKQRWSELRMDALSTGSILQLIDNTANYLTSNEAVTRNYQKWNNGVQDEYQAAVNNLKVYVENRANWMDSQIEAL